MVATPGNSLNITAAGLVKFDGTSAFSGVTTTQHDLLIGAASNGITSVAPSATSGVPVISQGASADPTFGTAVVAGGGTGLTSATAYAVLCGGTTSTGNFQSVASVGTSGQLLTSNGAGALPTFQTASGVGGSLTLIQTQTASSSASLSFTTGITTTYTNYVLIYNNAIPATNSVDLELLVSTNGGSSYIAANYVSGILFGAYNNASGINGGAQTATTYFLLDRSITNTTTTSGGWINLFDFTTASSTSFPKINGWQSTNAGGLFTRHCVGWNSGVGANAINAIQVAYSSGNMTTGQFSLYGVSK